MFHKQPNTIIWGQTQRLTHHWAAGEQSTSVCVCQSLSRHEALLEWRVVYKLLTSTKAKPKNMFPYKTKRLQTQTHTCIFLLRPQHSQISATKGGRLKEHAWERPLSAAQGSSCSGFSDECATRRPLTSLEEKIKVCERPDRLGSATNPEMSELGLPGLESSMNDKLCNKWKQGMHLPQNNTWPNSSGETNTTGVQGEHCALSHHNWSMIDVWTGYWEGEYN